MPTVLSWVKLFQSFPELTRALMGSGELHVVIGGRAKGPHIVSSKVIVVAEKFKRRWKDLVELRRIQPCWPYLFLPVACVTERSNKVKVYRFTVANCLSHKINLSYWMKLEKHKYHRSDLPWTSSRLGPYFSAITFECVESREPNFRNERFRTSGNFYYLGFLTPNKN